MKLNSLFDIKAVRSMIMELGIQYLWWVGSSTRWQIQGEENFFLERCRGRPLIFAFWHNQLMMMPYCYLSLARSRKVSVLISQSRDGEIVSDFVAKAGFDRIRGSSSRGGPTALRRLTRKLSEGFDLAITPDGPRGPGLQAQMGVVSLASASSCPILPVAYDFKREKIFSSWDRFKLPSPCNRAALVVGSALHVEPNRDPEYLLGKLNEVQLALDEVNQRARQLVSGES